MLHIRWRMKEALADGAATGMKAAVRRGSLRRAARSLIRFAAQVERVRSQREQTGD